MKKFKKKVVKVGDEKMEALFRIIFKRFGRFYVKWGTSLLARGRNGGDICEIGHRRKGREDYQVLELAQVYSFNRCVCIRSIIRIEFSGCLTKKYLVKFKGKIIDRGIADGIAGPGENEKFPDLEYYALVKRI